MIVSLTPTCSTPASSKVSQKMPAIFLSSSFTPEAAQFLRAVLEESVTQVIKANGVTIPVLSQFTEVRLIDSTTITLPDDLETVWKSLEERLSDLDLKLHNAYRVV